MSGKLSGEAIAFLSKPIHGVIASFDLGGALHQVPVNAVLDEESSPHRLLILAGGSSKKVRNLRRNPAASFCVFQGQSYVSIFGVAEVIEDASEIQRVESLYKKKYSKTPRINPSRVVVSIECSRSIEHRLDV